MSLSNHKKWNCVRNVHIFMRKIHFSKRLLKIFIKNDWKHEIQQQTREGHLANSIKTLRAYSLSGLCRGLNNYNRIYHSARCNVHPRLFAVESVHVNTEFFYHTTTRVALSSCYQLQNFAFCHTDNKRTAQFSSTVELIEPYFIHVRSVM